jgi:hypothetical protein
MKSNVLKGIIQNSMKIVPLIIVLILLNSCDSKVENLKDKEIMNYISSLEDAVDSLNQNVDSLNYRLIQLEEGSKNKELVTEMRTDGPKVDRKIICPKCNGEGSIQVTCGKCRGSGWDVNHENMGCLGCGATWGSSRPAKGYVNKTCNVCNGNGRINEYE